MESSKCILCETTSTAELSSAKPAHNARRRRSATPAAMLARTMILLALAASAEAFTAMPMHASPRTGGRSAVPKAFAPDSLMFTASVVVTVSGLAISSPIIFEHAYRGLAKNQKEMSEEGAQLAQLNHELNTMKMDVAKQRVVRGLIKTTGADATAQGRVAPRYRVQGVTQLQSESAVPVVAEANDAGDLPCSIFEGEFGI